MAGVLATDVHVTDPETGEVTILRAGTALPSEFESVVGSHALLPDVEESDDEAEAVPAGGYTSWTVEQLKAELKERELPSSGKHDELVIRLLEADEELGNDDQSDSDSDD